MASDDSSCFASRADLSVYAHELRGALTVIAGYAELLRRPLGARDREVAVDGIERAIRRTDALCADALAGRLPASAAGKTFALLSMSALAEQVAADQRSVTGRVIDVTAAGTTQVLGDENALARVLGNLIDNAAKYSLSAAPIDVLVAEASSASGPLVVAEVADRGPGIPADEVQRLLEPFARLDRDADRPGVGLGLSIARDVATAHGGRLSISARDGGGTVVRLELPRA